MRVGSLFSGIGGLDLGLERAGMEIAWQSEIDSFCCRVLAHHWPEVPNHGDITQINPRDLEPVDLVCGGFPCQDLSVAGRRAGLAGARSGLWWEFHRILAGLRPRWVVIENVPGLLSSNGGRDMGALLRSLGDLGYGWAYRVLDAQWFGLAQRRKHVFIVGSLRNAAGPAQVLFEPESRTWSPPPRREAGKVAATIPASGAGTSRTGNERTEADLLVTQALTGAYANGGADDNKAQAGFLVAYGLDWQQARASEEISATLNFTRVQGVAHTLTGTFANGDADDNKAQGDFLVAIQDVRGGTRHRTDHGQGIGIRVGGPMYTLNATEQHAVAYTLRAESADASEDGMGRGTPLVWSKGNATRSAGATPKADGLAPTLRADMGDHIPMVGVRRLTPRECERLQGFPDGWTCLCDAHGDTMRCTCPDSPRYRALGNAVAVPVAEWIGRRIMAVEATNNTRAEAR